MEGDGWELGSRKSLCNYLDRCPHPPTHILFCIKITWAYFAKHTFPRERLTHRCEVRPKQVYLEKSPWLFECSAKFGNHWLRSIFLLQMRKPRLKKKKGLTQNPTVGIQPGAGSQISGFFPRDISVLSNPKEGERTPTASVLRGRTFGKGSPRRGLPQGKQA